MSASKHIIQLSNALAAYFENLSAGNSDNQPQSINLEDVFKHVHEAVPDATPEEIMYILQLFLQPGGEGEDTLDAEDDFGAFDFGEGEGGDMGFSFGVDAE